MTTYTEFLNNVEPTYVFRTSNGDFKNLYELCAALKQQGKPLFHRHVTSTKNDFANWIKDIIHDNDLAIALLNTKDYYAAVEIITNRINELERDKSKASYFDSIGNLFVPDYETHSGEMTVFENRFSSQDLPEINDELDTSDKITAFYNTTFADLPKNELFANSENVTDPELNSFIRMTSEAFGEVEVALEKDRVYEEVLVNNAPKKTFFSNFVFDIGIKRMLKRFFGQ
jgi:hypothetical protein